MAKPLTLLESLLVAQLVETMEQANRLEEYMLTVLMGTGLTKQQANKALGR